MPSISELGQMEFMGFPAFKEAQNQVSLANLLQQQNLEKGAGQIEAQNLKNLFDRQNDPQRLDQQRLANESTGLQNTMNGVKARNDTAMEGEDLETRRQKAFATASEEQLKGLSAKAQAMMLHPDPAIAEKGRKMMDASYEELTRRRKASDDLNKAQTVADARLAAVEAQQNGANSRNERDNETRLATAAKKASGKTGDILGAVTAGKMGFEKAATSFEVMASMEDDPARAAQYSELAKKFATANISQKNAVAGTKVDLSKLGIDTNQVMLGVGGPATRVGGGGGSVQNAAPMTRGAGDPPAGSGLPTSKEEADTQRMTYDMAAIEREYMTAKDPAIRKVLAEQIGRMRAENAAKTGGAVAQPAKAPAIAAPAGRVVIYKDGKPVGSVPQAQAEAAKKQGYTLN